MPSTVNRRRLRAAHLVVALVASALAVVASVAGTPSPAGAVTPTVSGQACAPGVGVTVVVDFQAIGGQGIEVGCAPGQQANGFTALTNAGFTYNEKDGSAVAGTICQVRNQPTAGFPTCWYSGFWGYWKSNGAQAWQWSDVGASDGPLAVDRVEGWSWTSPIPEDYSGAPIRLTVPQVQALTATPDCAVIPQLPTFDIVSNAETLPVTLAGGGAVEVAVLPAAADPATATWTTATSVPLTGITGSTRILARRAGNPCPTQRFDATYDVRTAYAPRWNNASTVDGWPSPAVDKADARIKGWITGHSEYTPGGNVNAGFQTPTNPYGPHDGSLVVLGDRGSYTATFGKPIKDGTGADFAVFENGFTVGAPTAPIDFLELAYLEVSSNGTDFVRFDSASRRTATVGAFAGQLANELGGLPGKDVANKGTPFDLSVLGNKPQVRSGLVDLGRITHVRLKDIKGDGADLDSFGRPIYDPNPVTGSAGFDLTGIGVLNQLDEVAPVVAITSAPSGTTTATSASISYTNDDATAYVERQLDGGTWVPATSPIALTGLGVGPHTLVLRATDPAGNVGTATATWTVSAVTVTSNLAAPVIGQSVKLTATTAAGAKGTATFYDGATKLGAAAVKNGVGTLATAKLSPGTRAITAQFTATGSTAVDTSPVFAQQVERGATTAAVTAAPTTTVFGQATKLTARLTPVAPAAGRAGGPVSFYDDGTLLATVNAVNGAASLTVSRAVGTHPITAVYAGSTSWVGSAAAPTDHVVGQAQTTTAVTSSANPSVAGQAVTITVKVKAVAPSKAVPGGTIDLYDGAELVATLEAPRGVATLRVVPTVGAHSYSAVYRGSTEAAGSTGSVEQQVDRAASTIVLKSSAASRPFGKAVSVTAVVSAVKPGVGSGTGQLTLRVDGTPVATVTLAAGRAVIPLPTLPVGTHSVTATYVGDGQLLASASTTPLVQTIT